MRQKIRSELKAIEPLDRTEQEHLRDALAWVDSGVDLFRTSKPATPPKHLVSYFSLIDEGHILLVDHKNAQLWLPPGGHVEPGEHPRRAVERELEEELGVRPAHPIEAPLVVTCTTTVGLTAGHTDMSLWYVVHASRHQPMMFDAGEFDCVQWFEFADAPYHRSDPHLRRFVQKLVP